MGFRNSEEAKREQNGITYFIRKNILIEYMLQIYHMYQKISEKKNGLL